MVELADWQERFEALGVTLAAMSYDSPEVLDAFRTEHDIGYPLLQDVDAKHVKAYGVLNPEYEPGHAAYGIPLPGVLFVAPDGRVRAKFAEPDYKARPRFEDIYGAVSSLVQAAGPTD